MSHYFILEFTTNKGRFSLYMEFHMRQGADAVIFILLSYFITIVWGEGFINSDRGADTDLTPKYYLTRQVHVSIVTYIPASP